MTRHDMLKWFASIRVGVVVTVSMACMSCTSSAPIGSAFRTDAIGPAAAVPRPGPAPTTGPAARALTTAPAAPESATQPASQHATTMPSSGPLRLTAEDAVFMALANNRALAVERLTPPIRRTQEQIERAAFDPVLSAEASFGRTRAEMTTEDSPPETINAVNATNAQAGVREFLPTGTDIGLGLSTSQDKPDDEDPSSTSRVELTVTQSLLRGAGIDVNLVSLRQTRLDIRSSEYELRGYAQDLVAEVEETYWDCALAQRQIEIVEKALAVAQDQYEEAQQYVRVGKLAESELVASEAEVALRRENLINARSELQATRLKFLRLLSPPDGGIADRPIDLQALEVAGTPEPDGVDAHVRLAVRMRPDLNHARLLVQRGDLELVKTRNGLLPKLDLFITLGKTGYAESFGQSVHDIGDRNYDVLVGLRGEFPVLNREARARHERATLDRDQATLALDNLVQLAEVDVRGAYIELRRSEEEVRATAATRRLQEQKRSAEAEKFRVGKSTLLLVGQAQRDLLSSQIAEVQAVVSHLKAVIELHRLEGSLLERRGIACPGAAPVDAVDRRR